MFITTLSILSNPLNYRKELKKEKNRNRPTVVYMNFEGMLRMNKFDIKHKKYIKASLISNENILVNCIY